MKKSELLRALQTEIRPHDFSTFLTEEPSMANGGPGVVVPGVIGAILLRLISVFSGETRSP
jgi:hypothetical protein